MKVKRIRKRRLLILPLSARRVRQISWISLFLVFLLILFCYLIYQHGTAEHPSPRRIDMQIAFHNPNVKNNLDLVKYAENARDCKWGYLYGTFGQILDPGLLDYCREKYPDEVAPYLEFTRKNWMGGRVTDCVGLIKGYGWFDPASGGYEYRSNGMPDLNANGMAQAAQEKGEIQSIPEIPGLAVWMNGHIGVYIGNGEVIEAMSSQRGVVQTKLKGRGWQLWLKIPSLEYDLPDSSAS